MLEVPWLAMIDVYFCPTIRVKMTAELLILSGMHGNTDSSKFSAGDVIFVRQSGIGSVPGSTTAYHLLQGYFIVMSSMMWHV
eukprot:scaffold2498_cov20-Prasinocladus_malaysianus.AAC.1